MSAPKTLPDRSIAYLGQGDRVTVYEDPITRTRVEGMANIVRRIGPTTAEGLTPYLVHFDGDGAGEFYERDI